MGRNATGVRGMNLAEKDYIVGMATTIKPEAKAAVKEGEAADLVPEKGSLILSVTEKSEVMLISQYGKIIRIESKFIRESGRSAQGVRLLNVEPGDRVAAAVVIPPEEPNGNGTLIQ